MYAHLTLFIVYVYANYKVSLQKWAFLKLTD